MPMFPLRVAISGSTSVESKFVKNLISTLQATRPDQLQVFEHISDSVKKPDVVIAVLTEQSVSDPTLLKSWAQLSYIPFVLLMLGNPATTALPSFIAGIQFIDCSLWHDHQDDADWIKQKTTQVEEAIQNRLDEKKENVALYVSVYGDKAKCFITELPIRMLPHHTLSHAVDNWRNAGMKQNVLCIVADPDYGLSTWLKAYVKSYPAEFGGCWFTGEKHEQKVNTTEVIKQLTYQLATHLPGYRKYLQTHPIDFGSLDSNALFRKVFIEYSSFGIDGGQRNLILAVDGLDSIENDFIKLLALHQDHLPHWLRFLVTSKDTEETHSYLTSLYPLVLSTHDNDYADELQELKIHIKDSAKFGADSLESLESCKTINKVIDWLKAQEPSSEFLTTEKYVYSYSPNTNDLATAKASQVTSENVDDPANGKYQIFFSYGHDANAWFTEKLKTGLEALDPNYTVWFDKNNIKSGDDWRESIYEGIHNSGAVVACMSKHSVRNPGVCLDELKIAVGERTCKLVSVLLESPYEVKPPISIAHIQYIDMSQWREKQKEGEEVFNQWLKQNLQTLHGVLLGAKSLSGEITELRKLLCPTQTPGSYIDTIQFLLSRGFVGREWLFEKIKEWFNESKQSVFCVAAGPGFGKSALVAQFACQNKIQVLGIHFCSYGSNHDDPVSVLYSLAFQVATRLPKYRKYLLSLNKKSLTGSEIEVFDLLFGSKTIGILRTEQERLLLVIDALDEAPSSLIEFVVSIQNKLPQWIKLLVTARPLEKSVRHEIGKLSPLILDVKTKENENDATIFIRTWLHQGGSAESEIDRITPFILTASQGNFRYLTMLKVADEKHFIDVKSLIKTPSVFPLGLVALYDAMLRRSYKDTEEFERVASKIFSTLAMVRVPLKRNLLEESLSTAKVNKSDIYTSLENLGGLVMFDDKVVRVEHKSVFDWLCSKDNKTWPLDLDSAGKSLIHKLIDRLEKFSENIDGSEYEFIEDTRIMAAVMLSYITGSAEPNPMVIDCLESPHLSDKHGSKQSFGTRSTDQSLPFRMQSLGLTEKQLDFFDEIDEVQISTDLYFSPDYQTCRLQWLILQCFIAYQKFGKGSKNFLDAKVSLVSESDWSIVYDDWIDKQIEETLNTIISSKGITLEQKINNCSYILKNGKLQFSPEIVFEQFFSKIDKLVKKSKVVLDDITNYNYKLAKCHWFTTSVFDPQFTFGDEKLAEEIVKMASECVDYDKKRADKEPELYVDSLLILARAKVLLASMFKLTGKNECMSLLTQISELDDRDPDTANQLGLLYQSLNEPERAVECVRKAVALADTSNRTFFEMTLFDMLIEQKKYEEATSLLENVDSNDDWEARSEIYQKQGQLAQLMGDKERAIQCYRQSADLCRDMLGDCWQTDVAEEGCAVASMYFGDWEDALEIWKKQTDWCLENISIACTSDTNCLQDPFANTIFCLLHTGHTAEENKTIIRKYLHEIKGRLNSDPENYSVVLSKAIEANRWLLVNGYTDILRELISEDMGEDQVTDDYSADLAWVAYKEERFEDCLKQTNKIYSESIEDEYGGIDNPTMFEAFFLKILIYCKMRKFKEATAIYQEANSLSKDFFKSFPLRSDLLSQDGLDEAEKILRQGEFFIDQLCQGSENDELNEVQNRFNSEYDKKRSLDLTLKLIDAYLQIKKPGKALSLINAVNYYFEIGRFDGLDAAKAQETINGIKEQLLSQSVKPVKL